MKKAKKIILGVVIALIAVAIGVTIWQWNNIKALYYTATMDQQALSSRLDENKQVLDSAMKKYELKEYTFSQEEMEKLASGELTAEEAAAYLLGDQPAQPAESGSGSEPAQSAQPTQTSRPAQTPQPSQSGSSGTALSAEEQEIRQLVATMYVLQATYEGKLEKIVQDAIREYSEGEHTTENKTAIVYGKVGELNALEAECDAQVASVVSRLRELLKATGQDDSLAKKVEQAYQEEKSLKKAYYIQQFQNG